MNLLTPLLFSTTSAFANPLGADMILPTIPYNPKIQYVSIDTGRSLYGCPIEKFAVSGEDPITGKTRELRVWIYKSANKDNKRAVIVLPPTGGVNIFDRGYANKICSSGITTAIIESWDHQSETSLNFAMHTNGALRFIAATRQTIELLGQMGFQSFGLLGTSIGAIGGSLTFGVDTRLSSAALIVGSARFADVIAASDERGAKSLREKRMKEFGFANEAAYTKAVKENVKIEPMQFLQNSPYRETFLISADADTTVPTPYQLELAEILKSKNHIQLKGNHISVIAKSFWNHSADIVKFFQDTL